MRLLWKWLLRVSVPGANSVGTWLQEIRLFPNEEVKELKSWLVGTQTILLWSLWQLLHDAVLLELAVLCNSENGLQAC